MKKLGLAIIALSLLLPIAAEAKGRRTFHAPIPGLTGPEIITSVPVELPEGVPPQKQIHLRILVKNDGRIISYGCIKRGVNPALTSAAEKKVLEQWRFKPATMTWPDGTTTPVQAILVIKVPVVP